jgi:uncharacterized membrane protein
LDYAEVGVFKKLLKHERLAIPAAFLLLVIVLGSILAFTIPFGMTQDEKSHFLRIQQISSGTLTAEEHNDNFGGCVDSGIVKFFEVSTSKLVSRNNTHQNNHINLRDYHLSGEDCEFVSFPNTAVNSPAPYTPHIAAKHIGSLLQLPIIDTIILMRLFGVVLFAILGALALYILPFARLSVFLVGLMPSSLTLAATLSADAMLIGVIFVFVATITRLITNTNQIKIVWPLLLLACSVFIALCKPTYAPILALTLLPIIASKKYRTKRNISMLMSIFVLSVVALFLWTSTVINIDKNLNDEADRSLQLQYVIDNPLSYLQTAVSNASGVGVEYPQHLTYLVSILEKPLPLALTLAALFLLVLSIFTSSRKENKPSARKMLFLRIGFMSVAAVSLLLIQLSLYLYFTRVGADNISGIHARYFIPLLPLVMIALHASKPKGTNLSFWISVGGMVLISAYYVFSKF